ncbi:MAG: hypothetical protein PWQ17_1188 [Anaerophaga sp.]|nr:hypothetical protein [Anaerophaga sp.]
MIKSILKNELILALFIVPQLLTGQNIKLTGDNNSVKASGTSTLHDWEMDMTTFDATA